MHHARQIALGLLVTAALTQSMAACACSRPEPPGLGAPAAPVLPAEWKVVNDADLSRDKVGSLEWRLEGKIQSARSTLYEINGKHVQLNTIVPANAVEADKIYRILANKKSAYSFLRTSDRIYEFVAGEDAVEEVKRGRGLLER